MSQYGKEVIGPGDRISRLAAEVSRKSWGNSQTIEVITNSDHFRGPVGWRWRGAILKEMLEGNMYQLPQNDGAGNKPNFFTLAADPRAFRKLAWEIGAMCADDVVRWGGFPSHFEANQIDFKNITDANFPLAAEVIYGYGDMLEQTGMANITGETAIMKYSITAFCDTGAPEQLILTWTGLCTGLMHVDKLIDGSRIELGQPIVGLLEPNSYRCNGGTFHIKNMVDFTNEDGRLRNAFGEDQGKKYLKSLCLPSTSYAKPVARLHGWSADGSIVPAKAEITGICHWTGGGIKKMVDILPPGVGAVLDKMPEPPVVQKMGQAFAWSTDHRLDDIHAYETLHGGVAMALVCASEVGARRAIEELRKDNIGAQVIGRTTASEKNEVIIHSRFFGGGLVSSLELKE